MENVPHTKKPFRFLVWLLLLALIFFVAEKSAIVPSIKTLFSPLSGVASPEPANISFPIETPAPTDPPPPPLPAHITTPSEVRGVYLTEWSAGNQKTIDHILDMANTTDINTVVIDIKDATGRIAYQSTDPILAAVGSGSSRIKDIQALTDTLHEHGIYTIGRVVVFEDPLYSSLHPEDTFTDTRTDTPWRNYKGITWLRPDSEAVWGYISEIAHDAYAQGIDEINLDYVRFPSDGELQFIKDRPDTATRESIMGQFFSFLDEHVRGDGIPLSADLFGLTMSATDDLGIGQTLEVVAPHVDVVCPMVYPSHFALGSYGIAAPATKPYEVVHRALSDGIAKLSAINIGPEKLRPWLQDFDLLGVPYTATEVSAQIQATTDVGLSSWLMWDPKNTYTPAAFHLEPTQDATLQSAINNQ